MKVAKIILGTIILIFSAICLVYSMLLMVMENIQGLQPNPALLIFSVISLIIGITLIATSNKEKDLKEFEEFKRMKELERQMYYRYSNAQGKPISEYLMDDRTKLVTYYDRMPTAYKDKLVNYADKLYRDFENEEYLNRK